MRITITATVPESHVDPKTDSRGELQLTRRDHKLTIEHLLGLGLDDIEIVVSE